VNVFINVILNGESHLGSWDTASRRVSPRLHGENYHAIRGGGEAPERNQLIDLKFGLKSAVIRTDSK
jgi:hypothetical protein